MRDFVGTLLYSQEQLYSNPSETAFRGAQIYPQKTYCPVLVSRVPNTLNNVSAGYILSLERRSGREREWKREGEERRKGGV